MIIFIIGAVLFLMFTFMFVSLFNKLKVNDIYKKLTITKVFLCINIFGVIQHIRIILSLMDDFSGAIIGIISLPVCSFIYILDIIVYIDIKGDIKRIIKESLETKQQNIEINKKISK